MFKHSKHKFIYIILLISTFFLNSCLSKPQGKPEIKPKDRIGLCLAETNTERNSFLEKSFNQLAKSEDIKLIVSNANKNPLQQKQNIEKMIDEKVKAVIVQPVDTQLAADYISMLQEKDIKVIVIDALPTEISVDAYIAPDYIRAGELQAQSIIKNATEEKNILILKGDKQNNITETILQGNLNVLKNNKMVNKIDIVEVANWDQQIAYNILTDRLNNANYNCIITHYEEIALGVNKLIQEKQLNNLDFVTIGVSKNIAQVIGESKRIIAIDTMPNLTAQFALEAALSLIESGSWEYDLLTKNGLANVATKLTPVRLINQENLYLLKERYGTIEKKDQQEQKNKAQEQEEQKKDTEKQTKLKIKTKDDQEFEFTVPGDIKGIEMLPQGGQNS